MHWQTLFFSAEGRIGRKAFWTAALVLFVAWILSHLLHIFAPLIWLVLIYVWVCVYAKRLHDFGRSAVLILLPFVVIFIALTAAVVFGGLSVIGLLIAGAMHGIDPSGWAVMFGGLGVMAVCLAIAGLAKVLFLLWVGLTPGDPTANSYGPAPGTLPPPSPTPAPV